MTRLIKKMIDNPINTLCILCLFGFIGMWVMVYFQKKELASLEKENAELKARSIVKNKEGEIYELEKQSEPIKIRIDQSNRDYEYNRRILNELRAKRPK